MKYLFRSIDTHLDFGFGATGESYYTAAVELEKVKKKSFMLELVSLPISFCYRHSIELFLKSLIIIFHKKLNLNYCNNQPSSSKRPVFCISGKQRILYSSHNLSDLYIYWKDFLLIPHAEDLIKIAIKRGEGQEDQWVESQDITSAINIISKYDEKSSFFRYPVAENENHDLEKYGMKKVEVDSLQILFKERNEIKDKQDKEQKGTITLLETNRNNEVVGAYTNDDSSLNTVNDALREVAHYFYCFHIKTRIELCDGE